MKKLVFLSTVCAGVITLISCSPSNQPAPSTNTSTPTGGGTTPGTVAAQQQMIQGNWIFRQFQVYFQITANGITKDSLDKYDNKYSPTTCFLNLTNSPSQYGNSTFVANGSVNNCTPVSNLFWKISTLNQFELQNSIYTIEHLTTDSLVLSYGNSGIKYQCVFNKTGIQPSLTPIEQQIAKSWNLVKTETFYPTTPQTTYSTTANNGPGLFLNQWSGFGWKTSGFSSSLFWTVLPWEVVQGRFRLGSDHYKIDTLTPNKFVISSLTSIPNSSFTRYTFQ